MLDYNAMIVIVHFLFQAVALFTIYQHRHVIFQMTTKTASTGNQKDQQQDEVDIEDIVEIQYY